jgi:hypothetical protein
MSGLNPVTVNGETFSILERYTEPSKAHYRAYWTKYFTDLGFKVSDLPFTIGKETGHNLEAILPGQTADSVVIIVHYDSAGSASNPGADDDMNGTTDGDCPYSCAI